MPQLVRAATRGSALARWQTDHVAALLRAVDPAIEVEVVIVETDGDRRQDIPIWQMGGKGVFVKEVQAAVLDGRADIAVHSAKDLPSEAYPGLVIGTVPARGDARDVLIGSSLDALAPGALVATGSVRRRAQLAWARPDLTFAGLRGNIDTRLTKIPDGGAVVMALAPLERLGLLDQVVAEHGVEVLEPSIMLPQVGQGALAIECRSADRAGSLGDVLGAIEDASGRLTLEAERGFLSELGGDCDLPAGAHATVTGDGALRVEGLIASLDGHVVLRYALTSDQSPTEAEAAAVGRAVGAYLLHDAGGASLLDR